MPLKSFVFSLNRRTRVISISATIISYLAAGCGELMQKERELTFRVEPGTASWYSGIAAWRDRIRPAGLGR
jgi:hypothetical protein